MFNAASKLHFAVGVVAAAVGLGYGIVVGDRVGFTALVFAGAASVALGVASFGFTPREPITVRSPEPAERRSVDTTDVARGSGWPLLGALSMGTLAVGLATGTPLVAIGVILGAVAVFAWFGQAWREHPSWTEAMNERLHDRFVVPIGLPGTIFVLAGIIVVSLSRLMLALSRDAAPLVGILIAFAILGVFQLVATRQLSKGGLTTLAAVSAGLVVASGVAGAVKGERDFAHHGEEPALELVAKDVSFDKETLELPAGTKVKLDFVNRDDLQHNFSLLDQEGGEVLFAGKIVTAEEIVYEFEAPEAGEYYFQCDVHPAQMNGTANVAEAASGEGGHGPGDGPATPAPTAPSAGH